MRVTIIADASWCPTTRVAGYGFWVACERGRRKGGGAMRTLVPSSRAAEMMALVNGLCQGIRLGMVVSGDVILLQTDCQGAIDTFCGRRAPSDAVEVEVVARMAHVCNHNDFQTEYRHVKGHTNGSTPRTYVNNFCDAEAKRAMRKRRGEAYVEQCQAAVRKVNGAEHERTE